MEPKQFLTDSQLQELKKCVENVRLGNNILFASSVLFVSQNCAQLPRIHYVNIKCPQLFDYLLTVSDEVRYLRRSKRLSIGTGAYIASRYGALLAAILAIPAVHDLNLDRVNTVVRVVPIVASETIIAARTWVIWGRSRTILWTLVIFSLLFAIPALIIIGKNVATSRVHPLITPELVDLCSATFGDIPGAFIVPYLLTILYEIGEAYLDLLVGHTMMDNPSNSHTLLVIVSHCTGEKENTKDHKITVVEYSVERWRRIFYVHATFICHKHRCHTAT
ncbi:hypothetical protein E1B28_013541 [Marasmius oreades]|uniref:DUF6533 domain-containing protein n=1 Tax=Marasmius oreades TaxID=181124 RepID=A0A9P7UMB4_9AGAR|nr:uncharacterized protein E1B28_013541 [Marasmius oreades]KAG7087587.1 hypothetical protein E1B28_013541 [Marasmius oreades]